MKGQILRLILDKYGKFASAHDALTFIFDNQLVSVTSVRDLQIKATYEKMVRMFPDRTKSDIRMEISAMDEFGRPSVATVKKVTLS